MNHNKLLSEPSRAAATNRKVRSHQNLFVASNFLAFLVASGIAFLPPANFFMFGLDGEMNRNGATQLTRFATAFPGMLATPFEGMGTIFQHNSILAPSLLPIVLFGEPFGVWLGYLACAALIFFSTYYFARTLLLDVGICVLAAWALPILCLPYHQIFITYPVNAINPIGGDTFSMGILALALIARGYVVRHVYPVAAALFGIVVWLFLANPIWIPVLVLVLSTVGIGIVVSHFGEKGFWFRTSCLILPTAIFGALGGGAYLLGLFFNTAASIFAHEMYLPGSFSWSVVSAATATAFAAGSNQILSHIVGGSFVVAGIAGTFLGAIRGRSILRTVARSVLVVVCVFWIYCFVYSAAPFMWAWPYPIYFEMALWPFYAIFGTYLFHTIVAGLCRKLGLQAWWIGFRSGLQAQPFRLAATVLFVGFIIGAAFASDPLVLRGLLPVNIDKKPMDTEITRRLQAAIGIAPNAPFRGYVVNVTGRTSKVNAEARWYKVLNQGYEAFGAFGNVHTAAFLWRFGIPTLEQYNELAEPAYYAVITRLLGEGDNRQVRNVVIAARENVPVMQSLGVRYIISDQPVPAPAHLAEKMSSGELEHYLYELPDPNLGNYSPTEIRIARDATAVLRLMSDPGFDFRKSVVLDHVSAQRLQPAREATLTLVRGGWRIRASSAGTSLLLLPVQFSGCLALEEEPSSKGRVVSVQRANLASTALIFSGDIDVTLSLRVSPFWKPHCRLEDAQDVKAYGLAKIPAVL